MTQLNVAGYRTVLITDDPDVAYSPDAGDFSDVQLLPIQGSISDRSTDCISDRSTDCISDRNRYADQKRIDKEPCSEIEETHLCRMLATIAATAESLSGVPFFLWCHLRGFDENWDFPLFLREKYRGEDDPEPYAGVTPPFASAESGVKKLLHSSHSEHCTLNAELFDDFRQSVVSAYAGGVTMFDELLEMLIEPLRAGELGGETLFLLAGTRGVLFGEHGIIGIPQAEATLPEPLVSALVQVPLAIRFPDGFGATVRSNALLQPHDITRLLHEWLGLPIPDTLQHTPQKWPVGVPNMLDLIREEPQNLRDRIVIAASSDETETRNSAIGLVTPSWFLSELDADASDDKFALYIKPDDRWDINNVADRCVEIAGQLVEARDDLTQRLRTNDTTPIEPLPNILRERYQ